MLREISRERDGGNEDKPMRPLHGGASKYKEHQRNQKKERSSSRKASQVQALKTPKKLSQEAPQAMGSRRFSQDSETIRFFDKTKN